MPAARVFGVATVLASVAALMDPAAHAATVVRHAQQPSAYRQLTPPVHIQLTPEQALAKAARSGKRVAVPGATTPTQTLAANPDGTLTVHESLVPVRKLVSGTWKPLNATLRRSRSGSVSPAVTTSALTLSGGGTGALATMSLGGRSLAMSLPAKLPAPALSGDTATYAGVLPGVDLRVTADNQGGFSEVLIVRDAAAAANPALRSLVLGIRASGVTLRADKAGDLTAIDSSGQPFVTAPAPPMWDSRRPRPGTAAVMDPATGQQVSPSSGLPLDSSGTGPGETARTAPVSVSVTRTTITLKPSAALLSSPATVFPAYIDSSYHPSAGSKLTGWTTVNTAFPDQSYWKKTSDPSLQVGYNGWASPEFTALSYLSMPVPSRIYGAKILSAQLNINENWSALCTPAEPVELHSTGPISLATTWNNRPTWGSLIDTESASHGHDSSCPAAGVGFNVLSAIKTAANEPYVHQETFGLAAGDQTDRNQWKQFDPDATMSITYDHAPNQPAGLSTSPATSCTALVTVGDGSVTLYAPLSDPDQDGLGAIFTLWKTSDPARTPIAGTPTDPDNLKYGSGSTAVFIVPQSTLTNAAGGAVTEFSWTVQATDFTLNSPVSATCSFNFDPTRPGKPDVTQVPGPVTMGSPVSFTVVPPPGTLPTSYSYQLNAAAPGTVTASGGNATITVTPSRFTNVLTVTSLSAGGNVGQTAVEVFNATPAAPAKAGDLTGDGVPDLLTVGGADGLPPGLWLAAGQTTGQVGPALDIGAQGNGSVGDQSPADFTGTQAITGTFTGIGLQDVLAYYPNGYPAGNTANQGQAVVLSGTGDGSIIQAQDSGTANLLLGGSLADANNDNPLQLANAGNSSGQNLAYPDLIGISGDSSNGYYLDYYPSQDGGGSDTGLGDYQGPFQLANLTTDGSMDWNTWTIATAQTPTGTAMYLWQRTTGALYLWDDLTFNLSTYVLSYTPYTIASSGWNSGAALTLQAADINGDGVPDLWTVSTTGTETAWLLTGLAATPVLTAQKAQGLTASDGGGPYTPLGNPVRILDTRNGTGVPVGPLGSGGTLSLQVAGNDGVPSNATAVVLNVAAINPTDPGFLTVYPDGRSRPSTSNIDFAAGQTQANLVTVPLTDGKVDIYNLAGNTDVLADLEGYYAPGVSGDFTGTASARILDTRSGIGAPVGPIGSNKTLAVQATGLAGVPTDATAVVLNVTVTEPSGSGLLTVYADGQHQPGTTNIDYTAGQSDADLVVVPVTDGKVDFWNHWGSTQVLADVEGYFAPETADPCSCLGSLYTGVAPVRVLDTRYGTGGVPAAPVGSRGTLGLKVAGVGGVPANATAVILNVTVTNTTAASFLTVYPDGQDKPATSNIDWASGQTIAGLVIVPVFDGKVDFWNHGGSTDVIADLQGYFMN